MLAGMTNETAKQKLARYEHVIGAQMAEITKLREENERLKKGSSAHGVLQSIYSDETQPTGHRIKAAIGDRPRNTSTNAAAAALGTGRRGN
jgi:hypothetical protein